MKLKRNVFFISLLFFQFCFCQKELTEVEKLSSLCKVWGFLKYYHPNVANGNYDWDKELISILPKVENTKTKDELSLVYTIWISDLGKIKACKSCEINPKIKYFDKNFDLSWLENTTIFSKELSEKLKNIESNRFQGNNHYFKTTKTGNIVVTNEKEYKNFNFPNKEFRLLNLFKFWNHIEYFSPYKYLTSQDWDEVLNEMIPKFSKSENETAYHLAMLEVTIKLDDSHSFLYTPVLGKYFGYKTIPGEFRNIDKKIVITKLYNDSLAKINDIKIGDVIEKINDKDINQILNEYLKYSNGSNYATKIKNLKFLIFKSDTDTIKLTINRNGIIQNKNIMKYFFDDFKYVKNTQKYYINQDNIGYINMANIEIPDVDEMMNKIMKTKGIIFDLRDYPKGTLYKISNYLNIEQKEFAKFIVPDISYPSKFIWKESYLTGSTKNKYTGKIVLLVNEQTQSHSEFTTMCLQATTNAITIGSQTSGADGDVNDIEFIGGYKLYAAGLGVFYPDESETQRKGIKIDIEINPTIEGLISGKDELFDKAIELINIEK
jgi:C-terminal processing protease CtpA/Prc